MINDSGKSVWSISPVLESNRDSGLVVFRVIFAVGLHGDVGTVRGRTPACLEAGGGAGGEDGEGEEAHCEMGLWGLVGER